MALHGTRNQNSACVWCSRKIGPLDVTYTEVTSRSVQAANEFEDCIRWSATTTGIYHQGCYDECITWLAHGISEGDSLEPPTIQTRVPDVLGGQSVE